MPRDASRSSTSTSSAARTPWPSRRGPDPRRPFCIRNGRAEDLGGGDDITEPGRVATGGHLQLQPAGTLGGLVLGPLPNQPIDVRRRSQNPARQVVEALEPWPAEDLPLV